MSAMSRRQFAALAAAALLAPPAWARMDSFAPVVKRVLPSVVNIGVTETVGGPDPLAGMPPEIRRQLRNRLRRNAQQVQGAGSGFIIDPDGTIVTNNHVVGQADQITVSFTDGTSLPAQLIGADELTDIAVIKVNPPHPLPAVEWGDSALMEVGDWVLAAGNPFGLGGSVTAGIVSARGRDIGASAFDDYLQIDAPINPGNSGGPLFNADGQVVGVNTASVSPNGSGSVGIGFAVPSLVAPDAAKRHVPGVAIAAVDRAGPAAKAGIKPGDVVVALNGQAVDTSRELIRSVAAVAPGGNVIMLVRRQGREFELPVTVGRRPGNDQG